MAYIPVSMYCSLALFLLLALLVPAHAGAKIPEGRIVKGQVAAEGQLPWQVILKRDEFDDLLCGGSIISNVWVLTAGHCVDGMTMLLLIFGTNRLHDENAVSMIATDFHLHSQYDKEYLNNDIALIKLPQALTFNDRIKPIALVTTSINDAATFEGSVATIAGFGVMDDEYLDYSPVLLYAHVKIINNEKCLPIFGENVVLDSTMCANGADNDNKMSICSGDSGGPLIIQNDDGYLQIGINSFVAFDHCTEGLPSGYVRLTSYLDFIENITKSKIGV